MVYVYIYIWYPLQQYSTVHISETTGPNSFKLSQFRQNKSTTSCPSYISIGLREHIISCMWNLRKINYFSSISVLATAFSLVALRWILLSFLCFWSPLWPCQATNIYIYLTWCLLFNIINNKENVDKFIIIGIIWVFCSVVTRIVQQ